MAREKVGEIEYEEQSVIDDSKIFYLNNKVLRAIFDNRKAVLYRKLLDEGLLNEAFNTGLVRTKISDLSLENCPLIIEHDRIDFFLHPQEMTDLMFWEAAIAMTQLCKNLAKQNLILTDAHPWNVTFHKGKPVFFDFGSLEFGNKYSQEWLNEFYTYFAVPLWLSHSKWNHLSIDYRRQHLKGFGLSLTSYTLIKKIFFKRYWSLIKQKDNIILFLDELEQWVQSKKPKKVKGYWDKYEQAHNNSFDNPQTVKQHFVFEILKNFQPVKVLDLASNKGFYALMAEHLGANVVGFDYEPFSVDEGRKIALGKNITMCQMDFTMPTPQYGWGLTGPDSFKRFKSNIVLALGLIHHVCLNQRFPVKLFCDTCSKYAIDGVILEFVYPEDEHVTAWNKTIPKDYNVHSIKKYFGKYFVACQESALLTDNNLKRQFFYFHA